MHHSIQDKKDICLNQMMYLKDTSSVLYEEIQ